MSSTGQEHGNPKLSQVPYTSQEAVAKIFQQFSQMANSLTRFSVQLESIQDSAKHISIEFHALAFQIRTARNAFGSDHSSSHGGGRGAIYGHGAHLRGSGEKSDAELLTRFTFRENAKILIKKQLAAKNNIKDTSLTDDDMLVEYEAMLVRKSKASTKFYNEEKAKRDAVDSTGSTQAERDHIEYLKKKIEWTKNLKAEQQKEYTKVPSGGATSPEQDDIKEYRAYLEKKKNWYEDYRKDTQPERDTKEAERNAENLAKYTAFLKEKSKAYDLFQEAKEGVKATKQVEDDKKKKDKKEANPLPAKYQQYKDDQKIQDYTEDQTTYASTLNVYVEYLVAKETEYRSHQERMKALKGAEEARMKKDRGEPDEEIERKYIEHTDIDASVGLKGIDDAYKKPLRAYTNYLTEKENATMAHMAAMKAIKGPKGTPEEESRRDRRKAKEKKAEDAYQEKTKGMTDAEKDKVQPPEEVSYYLKSLEDYRAYLEDKLNLKAWFITASAHLDKKDKEAQHEKYRLGGKFREEMRENNEQRREGLEPKHKDLEDRMDTHYRAPFKPVDFSGIPTAPPRRSEDIEKSASLQVVQSIVDLGNKAQLMGDIETLGNNSAPDIDSNPDYHKLAAVAQVAMSLKEKDTATGNLEDVIPPLNVFVDVPGNTHQYSGKEKFQEFNESHAVAPLVTGTLEEILEQLKVLAAQGKIGKVSRKNAAALTTDWNEKAKLARPDAVVGTKGTFEAKIGKSSETDPLKNAIHKILGEGRKGVKLDIDAKFAALIKEDKKLNGTSLLQAALTRIALKLAQATVTKLGKNTDTGKEAQKELNRIQKSIDADGGKTSFTIEVYKEYLKENENETGYVDKGTVHDASEDTEVQQQITSAIIKIAEGILKAEKEKTTKQDDPTNQDPAKQEAVQASPEDFAAKLSKLMQSITSTANKGKDISGLISTIFGSATKDTANLGLGYDESDEKNKPTFAGNKGTNDYKEGVTNLLAEFSKILGIDVFKLFDKITVTQAGSIKKAGHPEYEGRVSKKGEGENLKQTLELAIPANAILGNDAEARAKVIALLIEEGIFHGLSNKVPGLFENMSDAMVDQIKGSLRDVAGISKKDMDEGTKPGKYLSNNEELFAALIKAMSGQDVKPLLNKDAPEDGSQYALSLKGIIQTVLAPAILAGAMGSGMIEETAQAAPLRIPNNPAPNQIEQQLVVGHQNASKQLSTEEGKADRLKSIIDAKKDLDTRGVETYSNTARANDERNYEAITKKIEQLTASLKVLQSALKDVRKAGPPQMLRPGADAAFNEAFKPSLSVPPNPKPEASTITPAPTTTAPVNSGAALKPFHNQQTSKPVKNVVTTNKKTTPKSMTKEYSRVPFTLDEGRTSDADTIWIKELMQSLRLENINSPEVSHAAHGKHYDQPGGRAAREFVLNFLKGEGKTLVAKVRQDDSGGNEQGASNYGRLIGDILVNGKSLIEELVKEGHAHVSNVPGNEELLKHQAEAASQKKGIWGLRGGTRVNPSNWSRMSPKEQYTIVQKHEKNMEDDKANPPQSEAPEVGTPKNKSTGTLGKLLAFALAAVAGTGVTIAGMVKKNNKPSKKAIGFALGGQPKPQSVTEDPIQFKKHGTDRIPAMIGWNEFVMNPAATAKHKETLNAWNQGRDVEPNSGKSGKKSKPVKYLASGTISGRAPDGSRVYDTVDAATEEEAIDKARQMGWLDVTWTQIAPKNGGSSESEIRVYDTTSDNPSDTTEPSTSSKSKNSNPITNPIKRSPRHQDQIDANPSYKDLDIPEDLIRSKNSQLVKNHNQDFGQLQQRGGLAFSEILAALLDTTVGSDDYRRETTDSSGRSKGNDPKMIRQLLDEIIAKHLDITPQELNPNYENVKDWKPSTTPKTAPKTLAEGHQNVVDKILEKPEYKDTRAISDPTDKDSTGKGDYVVTGRKVDPVIANAMANSLKVLSDYHNDLKNAITDMIKDFPLLEDVNTHDYASRLFTEDGSGEEKAESKKYIALLRQLEASKIELKENTHKYEEFKDAGQAGTVTLHNARNRTHAKDLAESAGLHPEFVTRITDKVNTPVVKTRGEEFTEQFEKEKEALLAANEGHTVEKAESGKGKFVFAGQIKSFSPDQEKDLSDENQKVNDARLKYNDAREAKETADKKGRFKDVGKLADAQDAALQELQVAISDFDSKKENMRPSQSKNVAGSVDATSRDDAITKLKEFGIEVETKHLKLLKLINAEDAKKLALEKKEIALETKNLAVDTKQIEATKNLGKFQEEVPVSWGEALAETMLRITGASSERPINEAAEKEKEESSKKEGSKAQKDFGGRTKFNFTGKDDTGVERKGHVRAVNEEEARALIKKHHITLDSIEEESKAVEKAYHFKFVGKDYVGDPHKGSIDASSREEAIERVEAWGVTDVNMDKGEEIEQKEQKKYRYKFEAMDTTGTEVKDDVEANSEEEAQKFIKEMGFAVTKLGEGKEIEDENGGSQTRRSQTSDTALPAMMGIVAAGFGSAMVGALIGGPFGAFLAGLAAVHAASSLINPGKEEPLQQNETSHQKESPPTVVVASSPDPKEPDKDPRPIDTSTRKALGGFSGKGGSFESAVHNKKTPVVSGTPAGFDTTPRISKQSGKTIWTDDREMIVPVNNVKEVIEGVGALRSSRRASGGTPVKAGFEDAFRSKGGYSRHSGGRNIPNFSAPAPQVRASSSGGSSGDPFLVLKQKINDFVGNTKFGAFANNLAEASSKIQNFSSSLLGMVGAASPDLLATFSGSLKMLSMTVGMQLIPIFVRASAYIQELANEVLNGTGWIGQFVGMLTSVANSFFDGWVLKTVVGLGILGVGITTVIGFLGMVVHSFTTLMSAALLLTGALKTAAVAALAPKGIPGGPMGALTNPAAAAGSPAALLAAKNLAGGTGAITTGNAAARGSAVAGNFKAGLGGAGNLAGGGIAALTGGVMELVDNSSIKSMSGGENAARTTAQVVGGGGGAWAGAAGGAALGTMIFPGVGTVIGGMIGGTLGGILGSKAASAGSDAAFGDKRRNEKKVETEKTNTNNTNSLAMAYSSVKAQSSFSSVEEAYKKIQVSALGDDPVTSQLKILNEISMVRLLKAVENQPKPRDPALPID